MLNRISALEYSEALATHSAWILITRGTPPDHLRLALERGADADVIVLYHPRLLGNVLPDVVCWRRDTLAAALAAGTGIPTTDQLVRRAEQMGARVVYLPIPASESERIGPIWADAV